MLNNCIAIGSSILKTPASVFKKAPSEYSNINAGLIKKQGLREDKLKRIMIGKKK